MLYAQSHRALSHSGKVAKWGLEQRFPTHPLFLDESPIYYTQPPNFASTGVAHRAKKFPKLDGDRFSIALAGQMSYDPRPRNASFVLAEATLHLTRASLSPHQSIIGPRSGKGSLSAEQVQISLLCCLSPLLRSLPHPIYFITNLRIMNTCLHHQCEFTG
ncbi:Hypothetical protein NTJ_03279 [Nesidiocoris tenuis]|uniref:Uncharacterized protein n=1 Tax=Nesidiocoris tenuis TaxID=355587 RepID=A0ABN7ADV7_9HEMI|nr:Hypothetical protein NTJ_03279 [Nesidiocoris tenuis]